MEEISTRQMTSSKYAAKTDANARCAEVTVAMDIHKLAK